MVTCQKWSTSAGAEQENSVLMIPTNCISVLVARSTPKLKRRRQAIQPQRHNPLQLTLSIPFFCSIPATAPRCHQPHITHARDRPSLLSSLSLSSSSTPPVAAAAAAPRPSDAALLAANSLNSGGGACSASHAAQPQRTYSDSSWFAAIHSNRKAGGRHRTAAVRDRAALR